MPRPAWFIAFKAKQWGKKKTSSVENINCLFLSIDTVHDCISRSFLGWSCDSSTQKNVSNSYACVGCQTLPVKYIVLFLLIPFGCWCPKITLETASSVADAPSERSLNNCTKRVQALPYQLTQTLTRLLHREQGASVWIWAIEIICWLNYLYLNQNSPVNVQSILFILMAKIYMCIFFQDYELINFLQQAFRWFFFKHVGKPDPWPFQTEASNVWFSIPRLYISVPSKMSPFLRKPVKTSDKEKFYLEANYHISMMAITEMLQLVKMPLRWQMTH